MSVEGDLFHRARHLPFQGVGVASPSSDANPGPAPAPPTIPDHALRCRIGGGSYGDVWLARNVLGTLRAVKIVHRHNFEEKDAFNREFHGLQKFEPLSRTHEGLVDILQVGRTDEWLYYVMELADDGTVEVRTQNAEVKNDPAATNPQLNSASSRQTPYIPRTLRSDLNQRGRLPVEQCLEIGLQLTSALAYLHQHGLLHRDVKPSNIIFVDGQPKLADVGLVTEASDARSIVGTVGYIPIEGPGTPQADIFSLGKVLYEISTGRPRQDYPSLPDNLDELPDHERLVELNEVILNACVDDHRLRYASADEMHQDLMWLQRGKSVRRTHALKRRLAVGGKLLAALVVFVGIVGGMAVWQSRQDPVSSLLNAAEAMEQRGDHRNALANYIKALELEPDHGKRVPAIRAGIASSLDGISIPSERSMKIAGESDLRFSSNGARVAIFDGGRPVDVYARKPGRFLRSLVHTNPVLTAGFSPDGSKLFAVTRHGQGYLWETASGQPMTPAQFRSDFSDPEEAWRPRFRKPEDSTMFTFIHSNGALRIRGELIGDSDQSGVILRPPGEERVYSDLTASVDILGWGKGSTHQSVGCVARVGVDDWFTKYLGRIRLGNTNDPGHVRMAISDGFPMAGISDGLPTKEVSLRVDPKGAYRLVFSVVGADLDLSLFELSNLSKPLASLSVTKFPAHGPGHAGIWVFTDWTQSTYDVTIDKFKITGTTPESLAPSQ